MNNAGRQINPPDSSETEKPKRSRASRFFLPVVALLLVGAAVLMLQFFPILYGVLLPPMPPLPADSVELNHRNLSYGVDEWTYEVEQSACQVVEFYQDKGGQCPQVYLCESDTDQSSMFTGRNVAECNGIFNFSIFKMRWIATISADKSGSVFQVSREIFWSGEIPPSMEDIIEQIEQQTPAAPGD